MTTEKQILANQQNAQHSTGPRTEAGKRRNLGPKPWYWAGQIAWQSSMACRCGRARVERPR
jgi:hypothetical protein